jgi:hypothetical protein
MDSAELALLLNWGGSEKQPNENHIGQGIRDLNQLPLISPHAPFTNQRRTSSIKPFITQDKKGLNNMSEEKVLTKEIAE